MTINSRMARASLILILISMLGYILALFKEMLVTSCFGLSGLMDSFYAAMALPALLNNIFSSTFTAVFIPVFVRYRSESAGNPEKIASQVLSWSGVILFLLAAVISIGAPAIVSVGFSGLPTESRILAATMLRYLSPMMVFCGLSAIMTSILNTEEQFARPALAQISLSLPTIAALILLTPYTGVMALVYGTLAAVALQFILLVSLMKRRNVRFSFSLTAAHPALLEMVSSASLLILAVVAFQFNMVVDRIMASGLPEGSIAALGFADKLIQVPLVIFSGSIATAIFPYFSVQAAESRYEELKDSIVKSIRMAAYIFIPLTALMVILALPAIRLLFERGAFTADSSRFSAVIFQAYALQFLFFPFVLVISRVMLALRNISAFVKIMTGGMIANILLNLLFMRIIRPPALGIALSTSTVTAVTALLLLVALKNLPVRPPMRPVVLGLAKITAVTAALAAATALVQQAAVLHIGVSTLTGKILCIAFPAAAGLLAAAAASAVLRVEEFARLKRMMIRS